MPSVPEWVLIQQNAPGVYWAAAVGLTAHPTTRRFGFKMVSFGIRSTYHVSMAGARALLGTTLKMGGTTTLGRGLAVGGGTVAAGYGLGSIVGTSIAYAGWGKEGAKDALKVYSGQVGWDQYWDTVGRRVKHELKIS